MTDSYYFNADLNLCASEVWVADYLRMSGEAESREEATELLRTKREFCGWFACNVSDDIYDTMRYA